MDMASERRVTEHWRNLPVKDKCLIEDFEGRNLDAFEQTIQAGANVNVEIDQGFPLIVYVALHGEAEFLRAYRRQSEFGTFNGWRDSAGVVGRNRIFGET